MKTIILDTDILIDHVHGFAPWVDILMKNPKDITLILPTIVIAEYHTAQELEKKEGFEKSKKYLSVFKTQSLTSEIAEILGRILRQKTYLSQAGLADLIIASTAIFLQAQLATRNKKDFARIPGLHFFDPNKLL